MKKILFVLLLMLLLCGCEKTGPEYLISSIGFDSRDSRYAVSFEAIIINTENTDQTVRVLKGEGRTVEEAVAVIKKQCTQPMLLAHCGVVALGDSITEQQLKEIGEYCYSRDQITLSAFFVRCENAQKLLSVKPVSSACVGYDIMGLIRENKPCNNRFFEVLNSDYNTALPKISLKNGGIEFNGV